jgi:hypothetical protein
LELSLSLVLELEEDDEDEDEVEDDDLDEVLSGSESYAAPSRCPTARKNSVRRTTATKSAVGT